MEATPSKVHPPDPWLSWLKARAADRASIEGKHADVPAPPHGERLVRLGACLGLDAVELDLVACLHAVETDPFFLGVLSTLQRGGPRARLELATAAALIGVPLGTPEMLWRLEPEAPLRAHALIEVEGSSALVSTGLRLAARITRYLAGDDRAPAGLTVVQPRIRLDETLVPATIALAILDEVRRADRRDTPLVVDVVGEPGTGKRRFVEGIATALGLPLVLLDLADVGPQELADRLREARREQRLWGALLCLLHLDAQVIAPTGDEGQLNQPRRLQPALARFLSTPGRVLVTSVEDRTGLLGQDAPFVVDVHLPFPSPAQRERLLDEALRSHAATLTDNVDLGELSRRFPLDPRRIHLAVRQVTNSDEERGAGPLDQATLSAAFRRQLRHQLDDITERVSTNHRWEDMVVAAEVYETMVEMIARVRQARRVYDEWGFGSHLTIGEGVSALFSGPPGTGKTMCASVMARELGMELFRVDVSRVVSKWVGETEKNLARIFDEAQRSNAIILFDEADALFARRTGVQSAQDRYANREVNYLLQRVERFGGALILTTNLEDTIDAAFKRRLSFRIRFDRPDAEARALLWRKVFPPACQLADDVDPDALGRLVDLPGGNIRNAAVRAAFLAAAAGCPIDMALCREAALREAREMGMLAYASPPPASPRPRAQPVAPPSASSGQARPIKAIPITHPAPRLHGNPRPAKLGG